MTEIISGSIYHTIRHQLTQPIDCSKLPLYADYEFSKLSAESYGKVRIGLDLEKDSDSLNLITSYGEYENALKVHYFTYNWEVDEKNLPRDYEKYIKPEVVKFIELLSIFKDNSSPILRFSILDGAYKDTERAGHKFAVQHALLKLFEQL